SSDLTGAQIVRRRSRQARRPDLGIRREPRIAQHVCAHQTAGPLVHRRWPGAMPDRLEIPGAADQGDRGRPAATRIIKAVSLSLMIQDLADDEGFRVAPGLVVVAAKRDETIENDVPRLYVDN